LGFYGQKSCEEQDYNNNKKPHAQDLLVNKTVLTSQRPNELRMRYLWILHKQTSWQLAVGSWQLAVGSWQLAVGSWQLAVGSWQLAGMYRFPGFR
jgi:hypothetical protein